MTRLEVIQAISDCDGTPTQKLVVALESLGLTDTKLIAEAMGLKLRAVQQAKQRTRMRNDEDGEAHHDAHVDASAPECAHQNALCERTNAPECVKTHHDAPRTRVEDNNKPTYLETTLSPLTIADSTDGARFVGGQIVLSEKLREFWLGEFSGDEKRLTLALLEAAGSVQPNNRTKPLEAQVSRYLARIAGEKRDRDSRYTSAVKRNAATPASKPVKSAADYQREFAVIVGGAA